MRLVLLLVWTPLLAFGQEPKTPAPAVPADRREDTYAIYSAVLAHPRLSHPDEQREVPRPGCVGNLHGKRFQALHSGSRCRIAQRSPNLWRIAH